MRWECGGVGVSNVRWLECGGGRRGGRWGGGGYEGGVGRRRGGRGGWIAWVLILFGWTVGIGGWRGVATPHQRFIQGDLLWRYSYPHGENTVTAVVVPLIAFVVPLICMQLMPKRLNPAVHKERAIGGLCARVGLTWVVTCAMRNSI